MNLNKLAASIVLGTYLLFFAPNVAHAQLNLDAAFSPDVTDAPGQGLISLPLPDGKILIGGFFHLANGVAIRNLVRVNSDGSLDTAFNPDGSGPSGNIYAILPVAGNKFLIGGFFSSYNNVPQSGLVRINSDGTLDGTFNPGGSGVNLGGAAQTVSLQTDGKILISGGGLVSYNGNSSINVARLNSDGTFDSTFVSGVQPFFVEDVHQTPSGKIFISGSFASYSGVATKHIALVASNGALDLTFAANIGTGPDGTGVYGSEVQSDGKILIGGDFQNFNGVPRNAIARLNADGTLDTSFVPGTNPFGVSSGAEYFSIQTDGKILVSGSFDSVNSRGVVRLNPDGSLDPGFAPVIADVSGYATSIQSDSKIILTGIFTQINGADRLGIVRLSDNGSVDSTFNAGVSRFAQVNGIAIQPDGKTIVAGLFLYARGVARRNIARFNINGTLDTTFDPGTGTGFSGRLSNVIQSIALQSDGKIVAVGNFGSYDGAPAEGIVRVNSDGSIDPSFDTSALSPFLEPVFFDVVVLPDGSLVVAGNISPTSGVTRRVLHLTSTGSYDAAFSNFNINGNVVRLVREPSGSFLVGGLFTNVAGQARPRIARLNSDGTLNTGFNAGLPNVAGTQVQEIAVEASGNIMIGGFFNTVGGQSRNGIARLLPTGSLDTSFDPGTGANSNVLSIVRQADGKYFVGGSFSTFNSGPAKSLVLLNSDGSTDPSFTSGVGTNPANFVRRLMFQPDARLLVGGAYNLYGGFPRGSLVRLTDTSSAETVTPGDTIAEVGGTTIAFDNITAEGTALVTPISPGSVDANLPGNYIFPDLNIAFEIQTTATYTGSIVIAFQVPNSVTSSQFAALRILHGEGGVLVDRTILSPDSPAPDFANRTIYARVTSLSPFVIGQIVTPVDKNQCKDGSWQIFTQPSFRNQGDCVSFVESNSPNSY
jgi:uncharacterized delta-60 repeat protein